LSSRPQALTRLLLLLLLPPQMPVHAPFS
jgi:hypothetical protein